MTTMLDWHTQWCKAPCKNKSPLVYLPLTAISLTVTELWAYKIHCGQLKGERARVLRVDWNTQEQQGNQAYSFYTGANYSAWGSLASSGKTCAFNHSRVSFVEVKHFVCVLLSCPKKELWVLHQTRQIQKIMDLNLRQPLNRNLLQGMW